MRPPDNDKEMLEMDALSLIILELNYSRPHDSKNDDVKVLNITIYVGCVSGRLRHFAGNFIAGNSCEQSWLVELEGDNMSFVSKQLCFNSKVSYVLIAKCLMF